MVTCQSCGNANVKGTVSCPHCGRRHAETGLIRQNVTGEFRTDGLPPEMHDEFILRKPKIDLPLGNEALDPQLQQDLLICHLFANNRHSVADIARRFDLGTRTIIESLLNQEVIWDRRRPNLAA